MYSPLRTFLVLFVGTSLAGAEDKTPDPKPEKVPDPVVREDVVLIAGQEIPYKVTAAKLQLKKTDGKARASVFHISYERSDVDDPSTRPVLFAFNGGPGSSSVWLHLGGVGPRLVPTSPDGTRPLPPPHRVINNPHSILDVTDLVFIDPVSTGYSRPESGAKGSEFHGVREDIESVGDFIRRWITEHRRWGSPKFLLGESYGGIRAAGLAHHLQSRFGMNLNGVVLLSSLLDFRTLRSGPGDDISNIIYLPAFTAIAHHHGKITGDRDTLVREARAYANGIYANLLFQGADLDNKARDAAAKRLSELTGISPAIWLETDLRLGSTRFRKELLRPEGKVLGRFDARVAWPATSKDSDYAAYDPSYAIAYGAFSTAMLDYLTGDLGWREDHPYEILSRNVQPWNWGTENGFVNLSGRLSTAMRDNPSLRVLVQCGYTDLATPPGGIEHSVRHMFSLPAERRHAIEFAWYDAGHMFYLNEPDLAKMRLDLVRFVQPPAKAP
jgi:carboxypeptidase C (cathepsin A)